MLLSDCKLLDGRSEDKVDGNSEYSHEDRKQVTEKLLFACLELVFFGSDGWFVKLYFEEENKR